MFSAITSALILAFVATVSAWGGATFARRRWSRYLASRLDDLRRDVHDDTMRRHVRPYICKRCDSNIRAAEKRERARHLRPVA